jgi:hypothetical protein
VAALPVSAQELNTGWWSAHLDGKAQAMRSIADIVSELFIWGVGITRPKPGKEQTAALFITLTLVGTVLAVVLAFLVLVRML